MNDQLRHCEDAILAAHLEDDAHQLAGERERETLIHHGVTDPVRNGEEIDALLWDLAEAIVARRERLGAEDSAAAKAEARDDR